MASALPTTAQWSLQECEAISETRKQLRSKAMLWASGGAAVGFAGGLSLSNVLFPQQPFATLHVPTKVHATTESAAVYSRLIKSMGGVWTVPVVRVRGQPLRLRRHAVVTGACMLLGLAVGAGAGVPATDRQWLNAHPEPSAQQLRAAVSQAAAAREYTVIGAARTASVPAATLSTTADDSSQSEAGSGQDGSKGGNAPAGTAASTRPDVDGSAGGKVPAVDEAANESAEER